MKASLGGDYLGKPKPGLCWCLPVRQRREVRVPTWAFFWKSEMVTQSELQELLHYDPNTGVFTNIKARAGVRFGATAGCLNKGTGYWGICVNNKIYPAHRLAWLYMHGQFPSDEIDHINRVRNDNRICNLRLATRLENMQNQTVRSTNTSGCIGVFWNKAKQKWVAQIGINYKLIHIGYFSDLDEATAARKAAERKYQPFCHGVPQ